ncbi:MAG: RHS repeat protein, partial [Cyanothece sp. SIO1E1]|nr:RHS repeat protein [Cyanothece sp. SIO1E1]
SPARTVRHTYDKIGRLKTTEDAAGYTTKFDYDAVGNLIRREGPYTDPEGNSYTTTMRYDGGNRLRETTDAEGFVIKHAYDNAGNMISSTDGRGEFYTVKYDYDAKNRLVKVTSPTGSAEDPGPEAVERYKYDAAGFMTEYEDPRGSQFKTTYKVDARGLILEVRRPGGSPEEPTELVETSTYDLAGNRITLTDVRGEGFTTTFTYDPRNLVTSTTYPAGPSDSPRELTETFKYDLAGNLLEHVGVGGSEFVNKYTYDDLNRVETHTDPVADVRSWTHDRYGNVLTETTPFGTTTYTYDGLNRARTMKDAQNNLTTYNYPGFANKRETTDARNNKTTEVFDGLGRLSEVIDAKGNSDRYIYDATGNRTSWIDRRGTRNDYTYDARGLMLSQTLAVGADEEVTGTRKYDIMGWLEQETGFRGNDQVITYKNDNLGRTIQRTTAVGSGNGESIVETWKAMSMDVSAILSEN